MHCFTLPNLSLSLSGCLETRIFGEVLSHQKVENDPDPWILLILPNGQWMYGLILGSSQFLNLLQPPTPKYYLIQKNDSHVRFKCIYKKLKQNVMWKHGFFWVVKMQFEIRCPVRGVRKRKVLFFLLWKWHFSDNEAKTGKVTKFDIT